MAEKERDMRSSTEILTGIANEILASDEFKAKLRELGPDKIRENIERGLARLDQRMVALARAHVRARASSPQEGNEG